MCHAGRAGSRPRPASSRPKSRRFAAVGLETRLRAQSWPFGPIHLLAPHEKRLPPSRGKLSSEARLMRVPTGVMRLSSAPSSGPAGHLPPRGKVWSARPTKGLPPCGGGGAAAGGDGGGAGCQVGRIAPPQSRFARQHPYPPFGLWPSPPDRGSRPPSYMVCFRGARRPRRAHNNRRVQEAASYKVCVIRRGRCPHRPAGGHMEPPLRRRKLHIVRFRLAAKAPSFRCSSFPHRTRGCRRWASAGAPHIWPFPPVGADLCVRPPVLGAHCAPIMASPFQGEAVSRKAD